MFGVWPSKERVKKMTWKFLASMNKKIMVKLTKIPSNYLKVMSEDQKRNQD